jgi:hypothetical protein
MQNIAALQKRAAEYWVNQQQATPVWFGCKLDGETTGRRALVKAMHFEWRPSLVGQYEDCDVSVPDFLVATLLIERHPYWERTATRTFPNTTPSAAASVEYDYTTTADLVGDVPARINSLSVRRAAGAAALVRIWMGIRSTTLHGATGVTNFVPVWECEDGQNFADNSIADDGGGTEPNTASPGGGSGDYVNVNPEEVGTIVTWDDGNFHHVCYIRLSDVGYATESDGYGRYLWLLRAKVESGEWENIHDPVSLTSTSWDYYTMGVSNMSGRNMQAIDASSIAVTRDHFSGIVIEAQRISGSGDLRLDCLCPIPIDEGFVHLPSVLISTTRDAYIGEGPTGHIQALSVVDAATDYIAANDPFEFETFRLPPGDGRIVCVYARSASSVFTDQIEFADASTGASLYTERWLALRGAE